jgi:hypothetical protein
VLALVLAAGACSQPSPVSLQAKTASYDVELDLDGASLGRRSASIEVTASGSREPDEIEQVTVSTVMADMNMPAASLVADEIEPGRYEARDELFTMLGDWTLTVRIEGTGFDEEAQFTVEAVP